MSIWTDDPCKSTVFSMGETQSHQILKLKGNPFTVLADPWRMCNLQPRQLNLTGGLSDLFFYIYFILFNWSVHPPPTPLPSSPLPFHTALSLTCLRNTTQLRIFAKDPGGLKCRLSLPSFQVVTRDPGILICTFLWPGPPLRTTQVRMPWVTECP